MTNTPIYDSLVIAYSESIEVAGLAASLWLDDWYRDQGYHFESIHV